MPPRRNEMALFRSNNPALKKVAGYERTEGESASYKGIAFKALYYVLLTVASAIGSFALVVLTGSFELLIVIVFVAPILAFICSMVAVFKPLTAHISGSLYALFMGASVGLISGIVGAEYGGVVFAALISTVAVFGIMTALYASGLVRVGPFFRRFMISALLGIVLAQLIILIVGLFSPVIWNMFYGNSLLSIGISCLMVIFASLMILLDLDRMTQIVTSGMDKKYEWIAAFGLLVTLIWLYMEFLRLFSKIASRRR